jgi:hypothetical protein
MSGADYDGRKDLSPAVAFGGIVVKGFGRGSKDLGIPTANLPLDCLGTKADSLDSGIYFGWATVDGAGPYMMVMSVGWWVGFVFDGRCIVRFQTWRRLLSPLLLSLLRFGALWCRNPYYKNEHKTIVSRLPLFLTAAARNESFAACLLLDQRR